MMNALIMLENERVKKKKKWDKILNPWSVLIFSILSPAIQFLFHRTGMNHFGHEMLPHLVADGHGFVRVLAACWGGTVTLVLYTKYHELEYH